MEDTDDESEMLSDDHASNLIRNVYEAHPCGKMTSPTLILLDDFSFSQKFIKNDAQQKVQNLMKFVA